MNRRGNFGSAVVRGAGLAIGFTLWSITLGALVGFWAATGQLNPVARWFVRTGLLAALAVGLLLLVLGDI